jgi:hypothetical protein
LHLALCFLGISTEICSEDVGLFKRSLLASVSLAFAVALAAAPNTPPSQPNLSASEIADKNVAARGGLQAWRAVQTMSMAGKLGAGGNQRGTLPVPSPIPGKVLTQKMLPSRPTQEVQLPFVMELKRTRKTRLELQFNGQTAIQVYDGTNGWKLRPYLNRRVVEPFTEEEIKVASLQQDLDGPLVDYAAKGTKIELAGIEKVEDRDNYKLKLTMKSGQAIHIWIDAETFLETKIEGQPRRLDGIYHPVEIHYRDYRPVNGLQVPFMLETKVLPVAQTVKGMREPDFPVEKIVVEKVEVNPKLDESLFTQAQITAAANEHALPKTK